MKDREFSHREFWIFVMTVMHTDPMAKALQKEQRVALEEAIRKQNCPDIDYPEWLEIEKNIIASKHKIISGFMGLLPQALGEEMRKDKDVDVLATLDSSFREHIKLINLDELEKNLPTNSPKNTLDAIKKLKELQSDLKAGK